MKTKFWILAVGLTGVVVAVVVDRADKMLGRWRAPRPNVVLIIVDTLRADKLGCYGHPKNASPELDHLAADGVRFSSVIAQCSWTRPSIGSLLTSQYARSLGLYKERNQVLNDRYVTLAELLGAAGYATVGVTANPNINSAFGFDQGFDKYVDSDVFFSWMAPDPTGAQKARGRKGFATARSIFEKASTLVADGSFPYYVQINVMEMHEYWRGKRSLTRAEFGMMFEDAPDRQYLQALRQVSRDTSEFIEALARRPGWDNTLFVITSDHGEGLDDHPHVRDSSRHGKLLYESQVSVPLIMYHPTWPWRQREVRRPVRLLDVLPTVLEYVDVPCPQDIQGRSLFPLIRDATARIALPEFFVAETEFRKHEKLAAYSMRFQYIENRIKHRGANPRELQALGTPADGTRTDRVEDLTETAAAMSEFLTQWESSFPKVAPTPSGQPVPEDTLRQLKSLGYLSGDSD